MIGYIWSHAPPGPAPILKLYIVVRPLMGLTKNPLEDLILVLKEVNSI